MIAVQEEPFEESIREDPAAPAVPEQHEHSAVVKRLLESKTFARSPRLRSFLQYTCHHSLLGHYEELTEQHIGIHVFGRAATYNPGEDNIVRSTARQLRQRLAVYYQEEGQSETVRIGLPRGGYVAVFQSIGSPKEVVEPTPEIAHTEMGFVPLNHGRATDVRWKDRVLFLVLGFLVAVTVLLAVSRVHTVVRQKSPLWTQIFKADFQTLLVPGDAGLNLYDNVAKTEVTVDQYFSREYLRRPEAQTPQGYAWKPLAERRYTSIVDLQFANRLRDLPEFRRAGYDVRFARDLKLEDLRGKTNTILLGAPPYNPWVQLFTAQLNFRMHYNGELNSIDVLNTSPTKSESSVYVWNEKDPSHRGYATIALVPNLDKKGSVLIVQGTTMAGVDGAITFLMDNAQMLPFLHIQPNGSLAQFEVLLEAKIMQGNCPEVHLIASRVY